MRARGDGDDALALHGANGIFQQVPEDLLHAVRVNGGKGMRHGVVARDGQLFGLGTIVEENQSIFQQRYQVHAGKFEALLPGVDQEIRDDGIQARGFTRDNVDQHLLLFIQRRDLRKHVDGAGN